MLGITWRYRHYLLHEENVWIEGWKWYDAINARNNGTATKEQIEILDRGHWKEK